MGASRLTSTPVIAKLLVDRLRSKGKRICISDMRVRLGWSTATIIGGLILRPYFLQPFRAFELEDPGD